MYMYMYMYMYICICICIYIYICICIYIYIYILVVSKVSALTQEIFFFQINTLNTFNCCVVPFTLGPGALSM